MSIWLRYLACFHIILHTHVSFSNQQWIRPFLYCYQTRPVNQNTRSIQLLIALDWKKHLIDVLQGILHGPPTFHGITIPKSKPAGSMVTHIPTRCGILFSRIGTFHNLTLSFWKATWSIIQIVAGFFCNPLGHWEYGGKIPPFNM